MQFPSPIPSPSPPPTSSSGRYQTIPQDALPTETNDEPVVEESLDFDNESQVTINSRLEGEVGTGNSVPANSPDDKTTMQNNQLRFIRRPFNIFTFAADYATVVAPLFFLGFALGVFFLDKSVVNKQAFTRWRNAITVLATLFPILFASTVGRLVYEMARWKLEKGSTMGTLEQLIGSRTVGATLLTQLKLRPFNPLSFSLILLWVFSPLGAQSLLRMLESRLDIVRDASSVIYYDTNGPSRLMRQRRFHSKHIFLKDFETSIRASWYNALLLTPEASKTATMDLWGNVKIPFLTHNETRSDEWINVASVPSLASFSSLAGIAITNVSAGNTTFSLESSYIDLNCSLTQVQGYSPAEYGEIPQSWNDTETTEQNGSWHGYGVDRMTDYGKFATWSIAIDRFVDDYWLNNFRQRSDLEGTPALFQQEKGIEVEPAHLLFQTRFRRNPFDPVINAKAYCLAQQQYVESRISCSRATSSARQNCTVIAHRPSRSPHAPPSILHFSFPDVFREVSEAMPLATGGRLDTMFPDLSLRYLIRPEANILFDNLFAYGGDTFANMSDAVFSVRLVQLLNTYFLLSQQFLTAPNGRIEYNVSTPVYVSSLVEKYHVSGVWIGLCFLSCLVLLLSGVSSIAFAHIAVGPEILGYASTVIRDSKLIDVQTNAAADIGTLDSADIAVLVKNERVRYGFVHTAPEGATVVGVAREAETRPIKEYLDMLD